jgi:class 3 adenylate cyclase
LGELPACSAKTRKPVSDHSADLVGSVLLKEVSAGDCNLAGECERRGDEWSGVAVHTGARIGALAGAGEVLASRTVGNLPAGSGLIFESLGPQRLKGLPEDVDVYRVSTPACGLTP